MNTDGEDIDLSSSLKQVKQLKLDDAFLIQLFGKWKAAGALSPDVNTWVNLILSHNFKKALALYPKVKGVIPQRFLRTSEALPSSDRNDLCVAARSSVSSRTDSIFFLSGI